MNLSDTEVLALNTYLNGTEDLPVDVEALNVKLRDHLGQDNSVVVPEVQAAVAEEIATEAAPAEVAPEAAPAAAEPVEAAPVDAPVAEVPEVTPAEAPVADAAAPESAVL